MASSKDILQTSRPLTQRPALSSSLSQISTARQAHSRNNSHTTISGPHTIGNRVARRKSMSNNTTNTTKSAAVAAAAAVGADIHDKFPALPISIGTRRASRSDGFPPEPSGVGGLPSPPASMPAQRPLLRIERNLQYSDSAVDDQESGSAEDNETSHKTLVRRGSDSQPLAKEGRRFNRPEIHCQHCGKGYKHSSCLTKHLWEHTPEWSYTSKLLISKHQQVQLLEAASVLIAMNNQPTSPPDSTRELSPSISGGSSEQLDGRSSANTTPPPQGDALTTAEGAKYPVSPMSSDEDDLRSRPWRSQVSDNSDATSVPNSSVFGGDDFHQEHSPPPASYSVSGEADYLTKAVAMLSCSHGSNGGSLAGQLPLDIPPLPPVPAHFLGQAPLGESPFLNSFSRAPESFTRGDRRRDSEDVLMEDDEDVRSRSRSDEDEFGVFGHMEV